MQQYETDNLCRTVVGYTLAEAEHTIKRAGGTSRVVQEGSKLLLDAITSDFSNTRFNFRVEKGIVKHARIG